MLTHVAEFYEVRFEARPPLLRGRVLRPLSVIEFTEVCELLLEEARRHRCPYWLLDGRADEPVRPADVYGWLNEDFLPRVRVALGEAPYLAFVARPDFWKLLQAQAYGSLAPAQPSPAFHSNWFTDEATALAWLDKQRKARQRGTRLK